MGLMDFLKKKDEINVNADPLNFNTSNLTMDNTGMQQPMGMEYQQEQHNLNPSMSMSGMGNTAFGQPQQQPMQAAPEHDISRDLQMISLKLDAIKSEIDSINQRLKSLEFIAEREQSKNTKKWY